MIFILFIFHVHRNASDQCCLIKITASLQIDCKLVQYYTYCSYIPTTPTPPPPLPLSYVACLAYVNLLSLLIITATNHKVIPDLINYQLICL